MAERKETGAGMRRMSEIVVVLLVSLVAGLLAAMLVGMGAAALTVRGSVRVTQLTRRGSGRVVFGRVDGGTAVPAKNGAEKRASLGRMRRGYGERGGAAVRLSALRPAGTCDTAQPPFCTAFGRCTGGRALRGAEIAEND